MHLEHFVEVLATGAMSGLPKIESEECGGVDVLCLVTCDQALGLALQLMV